VPENDATLTPMSYSAGSLISVGHGRSVHLALEPGRFDKPIGWNTTSCGARGIARPPLAGGFPCGHCKRFELLHHPNDDGPFATAIAAARAAAQAGSSPTSWVTKTDVIRYLRCPYAWFLQDRGEISFEETVDEFQLQLVQAGVQFHTEVERGAIPIQLPEEGLPGLFDEELTLLGTPGFENFELCIRGRPDGIATARGALLPIEIKSHKDVQRTDELELAFYWLLLEAYRTREADPSGYLVLRRNGDYEQVETQISRERLKQVRNLIFDVRKARTNGVRPRVCGCRVCSSVRGDEVARVTERNKDLTLLFGIGPAFASTLEKAGIASWEALLDCDSAKIVQTLRRRNKFVSVAQVDRWKHHAESWRCRRPVFFGEEACVEAPFIALDLEYLSFQGGLIWLVGACLVEGEETEYLQEWADTRAEERRALRELDRVVAANPEMPIVTWSGTGADLPRLDCACQGLDLPHLERALRERHVDLFGWTRRSVRLPRARLDLKQVATYLGVPRLSPIRDGMEAELLYDRYRLSRDEGDRFRLRQSLCDYNRDDLDALVGTAQRLSELSRENDAADAVTAS
jgi:predicted RecB family nuclease